MNSRPLFTKEKQIHQRSNQRSYYCVAKWCNNHNGNSTSMFRVPKGERGLEWLRNADRDDLLTLNEQQLHRKYLCSKHFTPDCFLKANLLTWNAVPTLFTTYSKTQGKLKPLTSHVRPSTPKPTTDDSVPTPTTCSSVKLLCLIPSSQALTTATTCGKDMSQKDSVNCIPPSQTLNVERQNSGEDTQIVGKSVTPSGFETSARVAVVESDNDHTAFLEEFPATKQDVLTCSACGEVFLVESGLTQHIVRYHSETL